MFFIQKVSFGTILDHLHLHFTFTHHVSTMEGYNNNNNNNNNHGFVSQDPLGEAISYL